jgi:hypothetical protein
MKRLKFEMWEYRSKPDEPVNGLMDFTDGRGIFTDSWWSSAPTSIDHVGFGYLRNPHRHPNVANERHVEFIKKRFKEEVVKYKSV